MTPLLEREHELAQLHSWLRSADEGRGRIAFIEGEAGIGKSALIAEFIASCAPKVEVLWGQCDALVTPRALGPFLDIAETLGVAQPDGLRDLGGRILRSLRDAITRIVVIEDIHWADETTLELLAYLARRVHHLPVLLLATYRSEDVPRRRHPLTIMLADLITGWRSSWSGSSTAR